MISLQPLDFVLGRGSARPLQARSPSLLRRLLEAGRRWRQQSPPPLSAHLCRDIGLEPPPRPPQAMWPWP